MIWLLCTASWLHRHQIMMSLKTAWSLSYLNLWFCKNKRKTVTFILRVKEHSDKLFPPYICGLFFGASSNNSKSLCTVTSIQTFRLVWQAILKYSLTFNLEVPPPPLCSTHATIRAYKSSEIAGIKKKIWWEIQSLNNTLHLLTHYLLSY